MRRNPAETAATHNKMTRRGLLLGGAQLGFMGLLGLRMRYLQVDQADEFRLLAEENRINIRLIPPARGEIFDRNGVVLAANEPSYRITIVREDAGDVEEVIARLSTLIELDDNALKRAMTEMKRSPPFLPVTVAERISWEEMSRVAVNTPALPGVTPEVGLSRQYTTNGDFAHVIGYVGPVSDYDLSKIEDPDQLLRIPRFQIGKVGLEAKREEDLRGKAGTKRVEVNAVGRVMRELDRREGQAGADLQLTVDQKLQSYVQARLGDESAAAVVMDCKTGDVLAINSAPTFDPNLFVRGISVADYSELTENDHRPLATKSVQGTYPPGSTFKMITALAALEEGVIDSEDTVWCPGHLEISNRRFHCWKRAGHGHMNLETALRESCDVFFYDVALKVGIDKITDMARRLGLGQKHDLPMSAVAGGLTPTKAWKERVRDAQWVPGDTANASIGQGFVLASPLQLAVMTARLASGLSLEPRLIKSINGQDQTPEVPAAELDINKNHLRQVRKAMFAVSNHRRGTAYSQRIIDDEYRLAGKTGTSQVRNITAAERRAGVIRNEDLPWERRDHGLFVNFAPYDDPRIAVAVVVEHGGGSKAATPIARDITLQALFDGDPPLEAYPSKDRSRIRAQQERMRREFPQLSSKGNDRA